MNMNRVLPYISRSGASVIRLPPKFFSYQLAAAAVSGTSKCTWSYGHAGAWADGKLAQVRTAASAIESLKKSDRITRSRGRVYNWSPDCWDTLSRRTFGTGTP